MTALHFNEISDSAQAKTRAGNLRYQLNKPKYKKGSATVKAVNKKTVNMVRKRLLFDSGIFWL